jgi:zinc-binding alcohol dehydrogenase family protein
MKAVGYTRCLPIEAPDSLLDLEQSVPRPTGRDLLVEIRAVSVNPVDTKVRRRFAPPAGEARILGWDASGVVRAVGPDARDFRAGDEVWYAGTLSRPGTNSEFHLVDERIVGRKPAALSHAQAASLPLTGLTAWELLFDRLGAPRKSDPGEGGALLILGAAGGVGSILTQLARRLTRLTVIGTASRPETREWVLSLGAHHVLDHSRPLAGELRKAGLPTVERVASLTQTEQHWPELAELLAPQGRLGLIDDPGPLDLRALKAKSISIHWEYVFTRPECGTHDLAEQRRILDELAGAVDAGSVRPTVGEHLGRICAANLREAHLRIEGGHTRGKLVLEGF